MRAVPSILHIDMDAFFAAVEQRHKPSLRGKPVVVGGVGLRGVVSTASYEARVYGIGSAMPTAVARRRCPNAAYLFPRFGAYHEVSQVVMGLLREITPLVEPVSLDEAFIDLAAMPDGGPDTVEQVRALARRISDEVEKRTGLTASVGAGTSKLVAKVASDAEKPAGCVVVPGGYEQEWLDPLPVRKLWGVGPATADRLLRLGATTVEQLRSLSEPELVGLLGHAWGGQLYRLSRGLDEREVSPERETKSVSVEDTYPHDLMDRPAIRAALTELAERVVRRLKDSGHTGRTVTVKARGHDFTTVTRSETLAGPTDDARLLLPAALRLVDGAAEAATARCTASGCSASASRASPSTRRATSSQNSKGWPRRTRSWPPRLGTTPTPRPTRPRCPPSPSTARSPPRPRPGAGSPGRTCGTPSAVPAGCRAPGSAA